MLAATAFLGLISVAFPVFVSFQNYALDTVLLFLPIIGAVAATWLATRSYARGYFSGIAIIALTAFAYFFGVVAMVLMTARLI